MSGRTLVIGLGATGLSLARNAAAAGREVTVVDTRADPPGLTALRGDVPQGSFMPIGEYADAGKLAAQFDEVRLSSGVSPAAVRLPRDVVPRGDLEVFTAAYLQRWPDDAAGSRPQLALVTGTNGKSTCATLAAGFMRACDINAEAVGNIGAPLLDELERWTREGWPQAIVAEVSSFQLALRQTPHADIACLLNFAPDHLAWHGSCKAYLAAKQGVYRHAAVGIFNRADRNSAHGAKQARRTVGFGTGRAIEGEWTCEHGMLRRKGSGDEDSLPAAVLVRVGIMPQSACAALAIAEAAGACAHDDAVLSWLADQRGLAHRLHHVGYCEGVSYIDDSKATNQAAACAALAAVGTAGTVLIAGGEPKDSSFKDLARAGRKLTAAVLLGAAAPELASAFAAQGVPASKASDMPAAVASAAAIARQRGAKRVLLSPACASFDMYADFNARGDAFAAAFRRLTDPRIAHAC